MTKLARLWSLAMLRVVLLMSLGCSLAQSTSNKVLILSFSGFRWDYARNLPEDNFFRLMWKKGSSAAYVQPIFPTETVPAQYSIATGLYAESHGIVGTSMYDPARDEYFNYGSEEGSWWEGEPLWVTAKKQNKKVGVLHWPGSNAKFKSIPPSRYLTIHNKPISQLELIDTVIKWVNDMDLIMLFHSFPDPTGHRWGPESPEVFKQLDSIASAIREAFTKFGLSKLRGINVIVTSDHGMASVNPKTKLLHLFNYVNKDDVDKMIPHEAYVSILPKKDMIAEVYRRAKMIPHVTVYQKERIPEEFHYKNNPRVLPILILADEGWIISTPKERLNTSIDLKGAHGYSNAFPSMRTIFYAKGPDFLPRKKIPMIRSVDIYPLVCHLLDITPAPNNGSLTSTAALLVHGPLGTPRASKNGAERLDLLSSLSWMCLGLMALGLISYK